MKSARVWASIAVAVLVAFNVWIFYPTKQRPLSPEEVEQARLEFIETQRRTWADSEVVRLDDPSLESIIGKLHSEDCLELPKDAQPVAVGKLDDGAQRDLCLGRSPVCAAHTLSTRADPSSNTCGSGVKRSLPSERNRGVTVFSARRA